MKKFTSLLLSVLIVISACSSMLLSSVAATTATADEITAYFENPENWHKGKVSSNVATYNDTWTYGSFTKDDTVTTGAESAHSLKVSLASHAPIIELSSLLNKNTEYTLSFRYKADDASYWTQWGSSSNYWIFSTIGIYSQTAAGSTGYDVSLGTPKDGYLSRRGSFDAVNYTSATGKAADNVTSTPLRVSGLNTGEWYTVSLTFNSGTFSDLALVLRLDKCSTLYLDDFTLTGDYFETKNNWGMDGWTSASQTSAYPGFNPSTNTNLYVKSNTDASYTNSSAASLKMNAPSQYPYIYLPDYKTNTDYKLSFDYRVDALAENQNYVFEQICVFTKVENSNYAWQAPGIISCVATNISYAHTDGFTKIAETTAHTTKVPAESAGTWQTISITFNTENYEDLALILFPGGSTPVYMDNFALTELYPITVENGSADVKTAAAGDIVTITADTAPAGKFFTNWQVVEGGAQLSSPDCGQTSFVMPANAVNVKAEYDYNMNTDYATDTIQAKGNSIRKQSGDLPQGLRFKFFMDKDYETLYAGYTVKKVGLLVLPTEYLGSGQLKVGGTYNYNDKNYQPIDKEVLAENIQTDVNDAENIYFTAALTNIGLASDGTTINYSAYATDYTVRTYTVYEHTDGTAFTVYGASLSANVFAVAHEILTTATDAEDIAAAEAAIADCKTEYNAWVDANVTPVE